jgi:hypothetical protein
MSHVLMSPNQTQELCTHNEPDAQDWFSKEVHSFYHNPEKMIYPLPIAGIPRELDLCIGRTRRHSFPPVYAWGNECINAVYSSYDIEQYESEFELLAEKWHRETDHLSMIDEKITHPSYRKIVELGLRAIPLILRALQQTGGQWFWALNEITGENPVEPEHDYLGAVNAWIEWGKSKGHI